METIEIKNFGPIKHVKLDLKDINVFIGTTASGKSTVAKLVAILKNTSSSPEGALDYFTNSIADYNIDFEITNQTYIKYSKSNFFWELKKRNVTSNGEELSSQADYHWIGVDQTVYIPAERNLLAIIGQSIFGLMSNNVAIPAMVKKFGADFESARRVVKRIPIHFLQVEYKHINQADIIKLENGVETKLEQASSGFQSVIPLLVVVEKKTTTFDMMEDYIIIEEPELNLYPVVQKDLIDFVVERINKSQDKDKLIITTHSPYILTTLDNLIQAHNVIERNPEAREEVRKLVPRERWIRFERVACYYFENGTCRSTLDHEYRSIGPSNIDDVSDELSETYDKLIALEYANVS